MAIDLTKFFDRFREIADAIRSIHGFQGTASNDAIETVLAAYSGDINDIDWAALPADLVAQYASFRSQTQLTNSLATLARRTLTQTVLLDSPSEARTIQLAVDELIRQMIAAEETVLENSVAVSVTPPDADAPTIIATATGPDGITRQLCRNETLIAQQSGTSIQFRGEPAQQNRNAYNWPAGSGIRKSVTIATADTSLLANPSFDDDSIRADTPDNWTIVTGTIGTTVFLTATEVQTIVISGTPTEGHYVLKFTSTAGDVYYTDPLAFDAGATEVQAALAAIPGLANVSVATTGTSPNFTHTVTFSRVDPTGDQPILASTNTFDVGSIAHNEIVAGSPNAKTARSLALIGNGSQQHEILQRLTSLTTGTCYGLSMQMKKAASTTGIIRIALVDGAGAIVEDDAGTANILAIDASTLSATDFAAKTAFFRMPSVLPNVVYFQVLATTAISNGHAVYLDDALMAESVELYANGPLVNVLENHADAAPSDRYEIEVTNDFAGKLQTEFGRVFSRQLPSDAAESETIADDVTAPTTTTTA